MRERAGWTRFDWKWLPAALLAGAVATGCMVGVGGRPGAAPPPVTSGAAGDAAVEEFMGLLASARRERGCPPLVWDDRAADVALAHSRDMLQRNYLSHENPEGDDPFDRLRAAGVSFTAAAENIAYGARTGQQVFAQWSGSAGHRENMMNCRYTRHGVGRAGDRWTHVLFRP